MCAVFLLKHFLFGLALWRGRFCVFGSAFSFSALWFTRLLCCVGLCWDWVVGCLCVSLSERGDSCSVECRFPGVGLSSSGALTTICKYSGALSASVRTPCTNSSTRCWKSALAANSASGSGDGERLFIRIGVVFQALSSTGKNTACGVRCHLRSAPLIRPKISACVHIF